jgi:hypothetical protein
MTVDYIMTKHSFGLRFLKQCIICTKFFDLTLQPTIEKTDDKILCWHLLIYHHESRQHISFFCVYCCEILRNIFKFALIYLHIFLTMNKHELLTIGIIQVHKQS